MTKERAWPAKAMYILIAAALVMSFIITGAFTQKVSADPGLSEWTRVTTPTIDDWLLAPNSTIIDFAVADGGDVAYAIVFSTYDMDGDLSPEGYCLLKSEDGAATWDDITDALEDELGTGESINALMKVATDGVDADFVAVALDVVGGSTVHVYISDDGGDTFEDTGALTAFGPYTNVFELEVSPEVAGERDIAIGGTDGMFAELWRSTATGDSASSWENATLYGGWDDEYAPNPPAFISAAVVDIKFAPSWAADKTILVATATGNTVRLQFGTWGTSEGWNLDSILAIAAVVVAGPLTVPPVLSVPWPSLGGATAGITLPLDYSGRNSDKRYAWVNVNYMDNTGPVGKIFRVKNKSVMEVNQQIEGTPWLTNVHYLGYIAEGKAIAGLLGDGTESGGAPVLTACCEGVAVYRNTQITNMDICCLPWEEACKPPTGRLAMAAFFVSANKAYAVALGPPMGGQLYDEGAWSVSFDNGDVWNQLSLVDTYIHYFSDVAVSPDCNKTMLVSVNDDEGGCGCDSVWLHAVDLPEQGYSEYSGHWLRVWCGSLEGIEWGKAGGLEAGMLRLNPEETTGDTVYLFDYATDNVYWNELEGLACWDFGSASVDDIVDLAVLDKETIFALDYNGDVAMSDDYAIGWQEPVDSKVDNGYTIAVHDDYVLVGGEDGDVSYSDDGGETFTALEDVATGGYVTVAFDTYFDTNDVIYAALEEAPGTENGIYQWVIGESDSWMDLKAEPLESQIGVSDGDLLDERVEVNFTGLVVDRPGNPFTDAENGGVIYASYYGSWGGYDFTGAARSLEREVTVCVTCLTWDFLYVGLTVDVESFEAWPDALKICGCLTADSNTKLFAIDASDDYDFVENEAGSVWTFEDCYAKKAPEPTAPADGEVIPADPCSCYSVPFTLLWDGLCDACYYEIEFALDEDFTMPVKVNGGEETSFVVTGDVPSYSIMGGPEGGLSCETTYYWRVRASKAATEQVIHSWWSEGSFTVAPSLEAAAIALVSPAPGSTGVAVKNVGFSWNLLADADTFDWVLSKTADLSAPVESKTGLTSKAYTCTKTLEYGTGYYWKVTAYSEGAAISTSAVGTFTTAPTGAFCCPQDGLCFATQAELEAHNAEAHPTQPVTPIWVWVVIAIGAVLVIVVIVLIFRTRRV